MKEFYLRGIDVFRLVSRIKFCPEIGSSNRKLWAKYKIVRSLSEDRFFEGKALIVQDSVGVDVYLPHRNTVHPILQIETEFCEKLLLHWVKRLQDIHPLADFSLEIKEYPLGQSNVLTFLGTERVNKESDQTHDSNPSPESAGGTSPGQSQCTSQNEGNTSEPPK